MRMKTMMQTARIAYPGRDGLRLRNGPSAASSPFDEKKYAEREERLYDMQRPRSEEEGSGIDEEEDGCHHGK